MGFIAKASDALLSRFVPRLDAAASSGCYTRECARCPGGIQSCCPNTGCGACHCP
jgi:hypothetical protein